MPDKIRNVSPVVNSRCPFCSFFVRPGASTCKACGSSLPAAVCSDVQSDTPQSFHFKDEHFQNLQPDGRIKKPRKSSQDSKQLDLFRLAPSDTYGELSFEFLEGK